VDREGIKQIIFFIVAVRLIGLNGEPGHNIREKNNG